MRGMFILSHKIFVIALLLFSFATFFLCVPTTHAQSADAILALDPSFPEPGEQVHVSLDAYSMDTAGAQIAWYLDGVELTSFKNARSMTILAPEIGATRELRAVILKDGFIPVSATQNLTSSEVDIVLEAQTYIPQFYQGRALPSRNVPIRAVAIIDDGSKHNPSEYSYEWKYNQEVLLGGAVRGQQAVVLPMAQYQDDYLTVTVINSQGRAVGSKAIALVPADLDLQLYEHVPLRGESRRTINDSFTLVGDETSFYAEPYFANTDKTFKNVTFDWQINGQKISSLADPHKITVRRVGASGQAALNLNVYTTEMIPQYLNKSLGLIF